MLTRGAEQVEIVDVGPRDGLQMIGPIVPTASKISILRGLHAAGLRRIEIGSFVSPTALPQLADIREVLEAAAQLPGLDGQVLVPTARRAADAVAAGAKHLVFVVSVSEKHNQSNVRRSPLESVTEYERLLEQVPAGIKVRLNLATAFDCPFDGPVPEEATLELVGRLVALRDDVEIALCDTTGRVAPAHVQSLLEACRSRFARVRAWAFHGHNTYGMGVANVVAAWQAGVSVIDASLAGLGGCPFAPGATGNVATEDVVWMFDQLGVRTNVDLPRLLAVADEGAALPGASAGGRVRVAVAAARTHA